MSINSLKEIHQYLDQHKCIISPVITVPAAASYVMLDDAGPGKLLYFFLIMDGATDNSSIWTKLKLEVDGNVIQESTGRFLGGQPWGYYGPDLCSWKIWDSTNKIFSGYLTFPLFYKGRLVMTIINNDVTYAFDMRYQILLEKYKKVLIV